jgi:arginine exporter protein ArgO
MSGKKHPKRGEIYWVAVFAGLGLSEASGDYMSACMLVLGVFFGSALWWLILSEGVTLFRTKISQKVMTWVNQVAGIIIIAFGMAALFLDSNFWISS